MRKWTDALCTALQIFSADFSKISGRALAPGLPDSTPLLRGRVHLGPQGAAEVLDIEEVLRYRKWTL